jgi:hypothetical protein
VYKKLLILTSLVLLIFASLAFFTNFLILHRANNSNNTTEKLVNTFKNIQLPFKMRAKNVYDNQNEIIGDDFEIIYNKNESILITGKKATYDKKTKIVNILSGTISADGYIMYFNSGEFDTNYGTLKCTNFSLKGKDEQLSSKSAEIDFTNKKLIAKDAVVKSTTP